MAKKKKKTVKRKAATAKRKKCVHGKEILLTKRQQKIVKGGRYSVIGDADKFCRCCGRKKHVTLTLRTGVWRCCYCKPEQFSTSCKGCGWTRRRKRSRRNRRK